MKQCHLEITATIGLSERLKAKIPSNREILFAFLRKRPDLFGFVENQHTSDLITVEVKKRIDKLDDIYQAKLYKEVFDARYGFLIVTDHVPEEIKRLCKNTPSILQSTTDSIYRFLAIGHFDPETGRFADWLDHNPFERTHYWQ